MLSIFNGRTIECMGSIRNRKNSVWQSMIVIISADLSFCVHDHMEVGKPNTSLMQVDKNTNDLTNRNLLRRSTFNLKTWSRL